MKFDMPCSVAQRLMIGYDTLSEKARLQLEEHIADCSECRREFENMKNKEAVDNGLEKKIFEKAKKKINRKIICVATAVAIIVASLMGMGMASHTMGSVPYDKVSVDVRELAFDDVNWLPASEDSQEYVASINIDGEVYNVSQENYNLAKENGKIQYFHLTSKYDTDSFSKEICKVDGSYVCIISIDTDNNKVKKPIGPSWIQYDKVIDKIVYCEQDKSVFEAFRTGNDNLINETGDAYYIIWESEASRSFSEPKVLFRDEEKFGKVNAQAEIQYWKSYDEGELRYAFFIKPTHEGSVEGLDSWGGIFCELEDAVNGALSYDDLCYVATSSNEERYYWELVPNDCEYALVDGERLYAKTADINLEGREFTVKYIAGAVKNKAGKKGYSPYIVTLYDTNGNAHTA